MDIAGDFSVLLGSYGTFYLQGIAATILLSIVGTFGGLALGIFLAFGKKLQPKGKRVSVQLWQWPIKVFCQAYSIILRGTPMMVQAILFKYGTQMLGVKWTEILQGVPVFNGWMVAGLIVITLNTTAYMGEIIQAGLNGVDKGQVEGARSLGMNDLQILFHVTLPQAIRNSIPTIGNEWIVNIKDSSVLNVISVAELYFMGNSAASKGYRYFASYLIIALIYLTLTLIATGILKMVEFKMDGKKSKFRFINVLFHYKTKEA